MFDSVIFTLQQTREFVDRSKNKCGWGNCWAKNWFRNISRYHEAIL